MANLVAIVGRPNAGMSSIVNALLHENRVIVSDVSGTTRDSIDSLVSYKDKEYVIVDTAEAFARTFSQSAMLL